MAFKMKGWESHTRKGKINRTMDDSSRPDGRAKSSAFQKEENLHEKLAPTMSSEKVERNVVKSKKEKRKEKREIAKKVRQSGQAKLTRQVKRASKKLNRERQKEVTGKTAVGRTLGKVGGTKIGKRGKHTVKSVAKSAIEGAGRFIVDPESTDVGRAISGASEAVSKIKKGKIKKGIKEGIKTYMDVKSRSKARKEARKTEEANTETTKS